MKIFFKLFVLTTLLCAGSTFANLTDRSDRTIRVGILQFEPIAFIDKNSGAYGLVPDLLHEFERAHGNWQFEFVSVTWKEGFEKFQRGEIDLIAPLSPWENRKKILDYNQSAIVEVWGRVFTRPDMSIETLSDLEGKRIAINENDQSGKNFIHLLNRFGIQCTIERYPAYKAVFEAIESGTVDAGVAAHHVGIRNTAKFSLKETPIQFAPFPVFFATKKGCHEDLLLEIDTQLVDWKKNKDSFYHARVDHWLNPLTPETTRISTVAWAAFLAVLVTALSLFVINRALVRRIVKRTAALRRSEKRFSLAMDAGHDGLWDWNIQSGQIYYSPGYAAMLGYTVDEISKLPNFWKHSIHPEDAAVAIKINSDCINNLRDAFEVEFRMQTKAGGWRWILRRGKAVSRDPDGKATQLIGTHSDITDKKEVQQRLELAQLALDNSVDAMFLINADATFAYVNQSACQSLGYTQEDLLKLSLEDIDPTFILNNWEGHWGKRKEKSAACSESVHRTQSGTLFSVEIHSNFIEFNDREYICAFAHDITERKRLRDAIENRIISLTRPPNATAEITVDELFDLNELQRIQDEFSNAMGVTSDFRRPDGSAITTIGKTSRLCSQVIRESQKGCDKCDQSDRVLWHNSGPDKPLVMRCLSAGLWEASINMMVGDQHIATWAIGQVRDETQTEEEVLKYAREIGVDEQEFLAAYRELPCMSEKHFKQVAQVLFTLANQLSTSAYQNIQQARMISEERKNKAELLRLSTAIEQSPEAIVISDLKGVISYVNSAYTHITGYTAEESLGRESNFLDHREKHPEFYQHITDTLHHGSPWNGRLKILRKDGEIRTLEAFMAPVKNKKNQATHVVAVQRDITDELIRDEQFRQGQKMEAVGQLAGGISHDFNNIMQAILGFSDILMETLNQEGSEYGAAFEINKAAKRAAEMTKQLLTFSRKQPVAKTRINLNTTIQDTEILLQLALGKNNKVSYELASDLHDVYADHGQITQIIMNLAVNARDAMPEGGQLLISTKNVTIESPTTSEMPEAECGVFACLSLTDTGHGMSLETKNHLFEPFFTTKEVGQGTGLGLSVVYGIVKQNKGWIHVSSEENKGSTFEIYLPYCAPTKLGAPTRESHNGRILLVDNDIEMQKLVIHVLSSSGYQIVTANSAEEGLQHLETDSFDLIFSEVDLPDQLGLTVADRIQTKNPKQPILLYSEYRDRRERWENLDVKGFHFLQKPFSSTQLLAAVHDAITELAR